MRSLGNLVQRNTRLQLFSFAPAGLAPGALCNPTAYAVSCILSPLCGAKAASPVSGNCQSKKRGFVLLLWAAGTQTGMSAPHGMFALQKATRGRASFCLHPYRPAAE